ncbi:MAG: hypothetical protein HRT54_14975 [Colwellia sp.]|nr:hypothetical protein [Colwellia sp.]
MKIYLKWMLSLIFTLGILSNAQAYNDEDMNKKDIDDSLMSNWGDSALTFSALDKSYDLEALGFPIASDNIDPFAPPLINKSETHKMQVMFDNKNFSAQSGFSNKTNDQVDERVYFIKGSYKVLQKNNFSLFVTAKIESLNEHSVYQFYSNDFVSHDTYYSNVSGPKSYARFEILGQYSINNNWHLTGGVTSTAHEGSSNSQPLYDINKEKVALFGTTYIF